MKELIIRHKLTEFNEETEIYALVKELFEKEIKDIFTIPFKGIKVIGFDSSDEQYAIFKFDFNEYKTPEDLMIAIIRIISKIKSNNLDLPKNSKVVLDLVKRED